MVHMRRRELIRLRMAGRDTRATAGEAADHRVLGWAHGLKCTRTVYAHSVRG
jgi:hypothetical protein